MNISLSAITAETILANIVLREITDIMFKRARAAAGGAA